MTLSDKISKYDYPYWVLPFYTKNSNLSGDSSEVVTTKIPVTI